MPGGAIDVAREQLTRVASNGSQTLGLTFVVGLAASLWSAKRRDDGREQTFRIVGEDEADPARGTVSYVSPLARAVLTCGPGDIVEIAGCDVEILDVRR